jgi:uncharacterized protein YgiM (DUF1202 family)
MIEMRRHFAMYYLTLLLTPSFAYSMPNNLPSATTFFRSPQSLFPSGQASRGELEKRQKSQELRPSFKISWNKKEYWMYVDQLVRDLHCAKFVLATENSELFENPESSGKTVGNIAKDQEAELLEMNAYWALVKVPKTNSKGWIPHKRLHAKNDDLGVFVNLVDTFLRKEATHESTVVTTVPKSQRLKILGFDNGFLKTEYNGHEGYADLSHLVTRADFAVWGYHKSNRWLPVSHRENEFVITTKKEKFPLDEFIAFAGNPKKAVVINSEDKNPPVRSYVQIIESQAQHWVASLLPGHGLVWWKKQQWNEKPQTSQDDVTITSDELLKKQIFSIALEGVQTVKGLVSAGGVYKTEDGITWTKLSQFGDDDLPVAIHSSGQWFVGSYKSADRGKSFEPFIRWDKLAHMIEASLGRNPRHIRLQKIEALSKSELQLTLDTGPGHVNFRYQVANATWTLIR